MKLVLLQLSEKWDEAVTVLNQCIVISEQEESNFEAAQNYYSRSKCFMAQGKTVEAKADLNIAVEKINSVDKCKWSEIILNES